MKRFYKWVATHKTLATILYCALVMPIYTWLMLKIKCPVWAVVLVNLFLLFVAKAYVASCQNRTLKKPLQTLYQHGDPTPLFYLTLELLEGKLSDADRQIILIDHCVALREMGEHQKVLDILSSINIDKHASTLPITKVTYYNNLSDIYDLLGNDAQAEIWYTKMMQIYRDMPDNSFKKSLESAAASATAAHLYRIGEYEKVIAALKDIPAKNLSHNIDSALLWARASLQLNDGQTAKRQLQYVIENGNRLNAVTIAQNMLDAMQQRGE